jgi:phage terminase large subunit-like protein
MPDDRPSVAPSDADEPAASDAAPPDAAGSDAAAPPPAAETAAPEATDADAPTPVAPADGARVEDPSVRFAWTAVEGATNYALALARDADFEDTLFEGRVGEAETFTFSGLPPQGGVPLFWRVQAQVDGAWTGYGPTASFTVADWRPDPLDFDDEADRPPASVTEDGQTRTEATFMIVTVLLTLVSIAGVFLYVSDLSLAPAPAEPPEDVVGQQLDASGEAPSAYEELDEEAGVWQIPIDSAMAIEARRRATQGVPQTP